MCGRYHFSNTVWDKIKKDSSLSYIHDRVEFFSCAENYNTGDICPSQTGEVLCLGESLCKRKEGKQHVICRISKMQHMPEGKKMVDRKGSAVY